MTDRLTEIRKRLEAATPGDWDTPDVVDLDTCPREQDANLIANAPTDLAYLLGLVTQQAERIKALEKAAGRVIQEASKSKRPWTMPELDLKEVLKGANR